MSEIDDDTLSLMEKRVYDLAGISPKNVNIYLNTQKINIKNFEEYVDLYFKKDKEDLQKYCERFGPRWEVCVVVLD